MARPRWERALRVVGLAAMLLGVIDPLEGSVVILAGAAMLTLGAFLAQSRHARLLARSFALILLGVTSMFVLSSIGGVGGTTGRSYWWSAIIVSYPIGWVMGLVGAFRLMRDRPVGTS